MQLQLKLPLPEFSPGSVRRARLDRSIRHGRSFDGLVPTFLTRTARPKPTVVRVCKKEPPAPPQAVLARTELQPQPRRPQPNGRRTKQKAARRARLQTLRRNRR